MPKTDLERARWGVPPPFFFKSLVFFVITLKNYKTVLIEVKLIINNAPLTYV